MSTIVHLRGVGGQNLVQVVDEWPLKLRAGLDLLALFTCINMKGVPISYFFQQKYHILTTYSDSITSTVDGGGGIS